MGTILSIAFAIVSLFLLAMLIGVLGKNHKIIKIMLITFFVICTLVISVLAFNFVFEYNKLLTPMPRLFLSFFGFVGAFCFSLLVFYQASFLADVTKERLKEYLKVKIENISLPSVNFSAQREKFVRMAYSLFL